jgi:hypothetical protein
MVYIVKIFGNRTEDMQTFTDIDKMRDLIALRASQGFRIEVTAQDAGI